MPQGGIRMNGGLTFALEDLPERTQKMFKVAEAARAKLAVTMADVAPALNALFSDGPNNAVGWRLAITQRGRKPWNATVKMVRPYPSPERARSAKLVLVPDAASRFRLTPDSVRHRIPGDSYVEHLSIDGARDGRTTAEGGYTWKFGATSYTLTPPAASQQS